MATAFTKGHTYAEDGAITAGNLTSLMDSAALVNVDRDAMTSGFHGVTVTNSEPGSIMNGELWYDTVNSLLKIYTGAKSMSVNLRQKIWESSWPLASPMTAMTLLQAPSNCSSLPSNTL